MKKGLPLFLFLFLFLFAFQQMAWADESGAVSMSFRILPWGMTTEDLYLLNDGQYERLMAVPSNISRQYMYRGPNPMRIYRRVSSPQEVGGEVYELASEVRVDTSRSNSLLIVLEVSDGSLRGVFYPFDIDDYGGDAFILFNFTPGPIRVQMGNERVNIKSSQFYSFETDNISPRDEHGVRCQIAWPPQGQGWRMAYNKMVYLTPYARILLFVGQRGDDVRPTIKIVRDFIVNDATRESRDQSILEGS